MLVDAERLARSREQLAVQEELLREKLASAIKGLVSSLEASLMELEDQGIAATISSFGPCQGNADAIDALAAQWSTTREALMSVFGLERAGKDAPGVRALGPLVAAALTEMRRRYDAAERVRQKKKAKAKRARDARKARKS